MNAKLHECILTCRVRHQGIQFFPKRENAAMTNTDLYLKHLKSIQSNP